MVKNSLDFHFLAKRLTRQSFLRKLRFDAASSSMQAGNSSFDLFAGRRSPGHRFTHYFSCCFCRISYFKDHLFFMNMMSSLPEMYDCGFHERLGMVDIYKDSGNWEFPGSPRKIVVFLIDFQKSVWMICGIKYLNG